MFELLPAVRSNRTAAASPQTEPPAPPALVGGGDGLHHAEADDQPHVGSSDKDIWAAGNDGIMLHWDSKVWRRISVPTGNNLLAIWGSSDKDVWAVGDGGVVIRWDGTSWSRSTTPVPDTAAINDIWGTSGSNIWAVGDRGVIIQYNGSAWGAFSLPSINNLLTVWTPSTTDGWIGGDLGILLRWDGSAWSEQPSNSTLPYVHIRGTSPSKVWAAKQNYEVWTFDGSKLGPPVPRLYRGSLLDDR